VKDNFQDKGILNSWAQFGGGLGMISTPSFEINTLIIYVICGLTEKKGASGPSTAHLFH